VHLLALAVILFLACLYLVSAGFTLLMGVLLLPFLYFFGKEKKKYVAIVLVIPLVAWVSLEMYYRCPKPLEVRVSGVYTSRLLVTSNGRRFLVEGRVEGAKPGDLLEGDFSLERSAVNTNGYVGTLTTKDIKISRDLISRIRQVKTSLIREIISIYGFDRGSLMASLVLGYQEDINEKREKDMEALGVLHILSISGFHFALIEAALNKLKLRRTNVVVIILYAMFIDSVPGYRTMITLLYRTSAFYLRKDPENVTGLFFAMFLQSFLSPYLIFKTGFLLTYLSTLGILLFHKKLTRRLTHLPLAVSEPMSLTFCALSLSFPIILSFQPRFSLGIFVGNMFLVPIYTVVTYLSFLSVLTMKLPFAPKLLEPFIHSFFDLAYYSGGFLGKLNLALNFEHLIYTYSIVFFLLLLLLKRRELKKILILFLLLVFFSLPLGTSVKIYNKYGVPYIRVTHNFQVYDIIDYRAGDDGYISLREKTTLSLGKSFISIIPAKDERDVPEISVNGRPLRIDPPFEYFGGINLERGYIFFGERIVRYK